MHAISKKIDKLTIWLIYQFIGLKMAEYVMLNKKIIEVTFPIENINMEFFCDDISYSEWHNFNKKIDDNVVSHVKYTRSWSHYL